MPTETTASPRLFRDTRAVLVESPFWFDGALHWTDISLGELHISPADGAVDGSDDRVLRFPPPLASFAPATDGGWIVALGDRVILADRAGAETRELGRIDHTHPEMRLNEGKCDPQGRFVVGSMDLSEDDPDAAWYRVGMDGIETLFGGFSVTNGLEWSLDERTVYLTDTPQHTIYRGPWDPERGPGDLEVFHRGGMSDGLVIDAEGCFWNARYGEGAVVRIDPEGRELQRVQVPSPNVAGVAFGGEDLGTLFIGTARENLDEASLAAHPHAGGIFALDTAVPGMPVRSFAVS